MLNYNVQMRPREHKNARRGCSSLSESSPCECQESAEGVKLTCSAVSQVKQINNPFRIFRKCLKPAFFAFFLRNSQTFYFFLYNIKFHHFLVFISGFPKKCQNRNFWRQTFLINLPWSRVSLKYIKIKTNQVKTIQE